MIYDFLIVGQGIAGSVLGHQLIKRGYNIAIVNEEELNSSSKIAAGIFNPLTGKRIVKTWLADDLFPFAKKYYREIEVELNASFLTIDSIVKLFPSIEYQNDICALTDDPVFSAYLSTDFDHNYLENKVNMEHGSMEFVGGGHVKTTIFLEVLKNFFIEKRCYFERKVDYGQIKQGDVIEIGEGLKAKNLLFCEGWNATHNPYFSWLPFKVTRGEMLEIQTKADLGKRIINKGQFILPLPNGNYLTGSTFDHVLSKEPTEKMYKVMKEKLDQMLLIPYQISKQLAGIRPTVRDRRPFIGKHPEYDNCHIFNGLGTKGVSLAPFFANQYINWVEGKEDLEVSANISRYYSLYS